MKKMKTRLLISVILFGLILPVFGLVPLMLETQEFNFLRFMIPLNYYLIGASILILIRKRIFEIKIKRFGKKIIIVGLTLFLIGVMGIELTSGGLHSESIHLSDIPLWIKLIDKIPTHLVYGGIITTIAGIVIRRKQNTTDMRDMRK